MEQGMSGKSVSAMDKGFSFTGKGGEFFKIWIVNILLTMLTLGIYSAWAKVRTHRYFYGNTMLDGEGFDYHATPMQILKGRIIAIALLVIISVLNAISPIIGLASALLIMCATPWVIWNSLKFNARMSSYRNVRFNLDGQLKKVYNILLWLPLFPFIVLGGFGALAYSLGATNEALFGLVPVAILAVYLMFPLIQGMFQNYHVNCSRYGQGEFKATISAKFFYLLYLKLFGLSLLAGIVVVVLTIVISSVLLGTMSMAALLSGEITDIAALMDTQQGLGIVVISVFFIMFMLLGIWTKAYIQVRVRNYIFNQSKLDSTLRFESNMKVWSLFKLQTVNLFLIIISLGFAVPWVKVRLARYSADSLNTKVSSDLGQYVTLQQQKQSALTDELGEAFDVDADLGLTV